MWWGHLANNINFKYKTRTKLSGLTLVLEDCPKGALQHLIRREQRVKSASFIRSFAMDILKGLDYLHSSSFNYHGALTSLNCAVDG